MWCFILLILSLYSCWLISHLHLYFYHPFWGLYCFYLHQKRQELNMSLNQPDYWYLNPCASTFLYKCIDMVQCLSFFQNQSHYHIFTLIKVFFFNSCWNYSLVYWEHFLFIIKYFLTLRNNFLSHSFWSDSMMMYDWNLVTIFDLVLDLKQNKNFINFWCYS